MSIETICTHGPCAVFGHHRLCRGCGGDGCFACRDTGVVTEHVPTSDSVADVRTYLLVAATVYREAQQ